MPSHFLTKVIKLPTKKNISITFTNSAMPLTAKEQNNAGQTSTLIMVFFIAVSFSLIPANFITIIVKEKINYSKHIMRISGMNFFAYWLTNYIFELIKYYFTVFVF